MHPAALQSETLGSEARPHAVGLRWVIEGMFRWLGHFRRLMVRYEYVGGSLLGFCCPGFHSHLPGQNFEVTSKNYSLSSFKTSGKGYADMK